MTRLRLRRGGGGGRRSRVATTEDPVGLAVVRPALRSSVDRVVVRHDAHRLPVGGAGAHDDPVVGAVHVGPERPRGAPVLDEAFGVEEGVDVLAGGCASKLAALRHRRWTRRVELRVTEAQDFGQVGARRVVVVVVVVVVRWWHAIHGAGGRA
jgi:hypothetical protein